MQEYEDPVIPGTLRITVKGWSSSEASHVADQLLANSPAEVPSDMASAHAGRLHRRGSTSDWPEFWWLFWDPPKTWEDMQSWKKMSLSWGRRPRGSFSSASLVWSDMRLRRAEPCKLQLQAGKLSEAASCPLNSISVSASQGAQPVRPTQYFKESEEGNRLLCYFSSCLACPREVVFITLA